MIFSTYCSGLTLGTSLDAFRHKQDTFILQTSKKGHACSRHVPILFAYVFIAVVLPSSTPSVLSFINRILTGDALSRDAPTVNMWYLNFFSTQKLVFSSTFRTKGALIYERLFSEH